MRRVLVSALTILATPLAAQQGPPTCAAAEHRQFDFWIGKWNVTDSAGTAQLGTSLITLEEGACVIHEHWTGARGGTGQSFNFWNRSKKIWEQHWIANNGNSLVLNGSFDGHTMTLTGDAPAQGPQSRIAWSVQPDGRVRQVWSQSTDGGKTWQMAFDGWYKKTN